ncbi:hypothetical protein I3J09_16050 [Streptomyces clavuligerus]|uniref:Uncharacterized protein n=2 Tax=Streptomyces clavuligerus TaxID=1901 RepID=B5GPN0_STRCL|nr:hypothetical protein BB341_15850 [Streptomyces clavuligerus]AXU16591.1 hypothetical protein D1794_16530 [Streptomyces clavuligerus]EDY48276.1 hypothetical protein SSCG_01557 [Streptomyces clavuligerus]EFG07598.1 Hypothetical protein SCLAV_2526 [Streptomyces clavuligerus]MBY6304189.1 hypothetical protein [Streptomyces clavuligerus]
MASTQLPGPCLPPYRAQSAMALLDPQEHASELADWVERIPASSEPVEREAWDNVYAWLRLASGLRTVTFDMAYEDGGMCAAGDDFDYVWSNMMGEWQLHQLRLGYTRAALEALVRVLLPDLPTPGPAIDAAELRLARAGQEPPLHAREATRHFLAHATESSEPSSLAVAVTQAIGVHELAAHGFTRIPQPAHDDDMQSFPAGHDEICTSKEATSILLLGIQALLAWAVEERHIVAPNEDKFLCEGMWVPDSAGGSQWVDQEISYGDYLAVLQLDHGDPPDL